MKRITRRCTLLCVGALLALALLGTSCAKKEVAVTPPWEIGEKSVFQVTQDGTVLATWEMRVDPDEAGIALVSELRGEGFSEIARVKVDPRSLLPEAVSFLQETELTKAGYIATYTMDEAIVTPEPPAGSPDVPVTRIDIPEGPHFENESLVMILRALPLKKGLRATLTDVVTRTGTVASVDVKVTREETITTVLGELKCYVVELVGFSQAVWIAKDSPHQILRFENEAAKTVSELTEYVPK
jgi:hypothetical protein